MQNPTYLLQNATLPSKQCFVSSKVYFVFKRHTQTIISVDISKHKLNTDVLNGKHQYEGLISSIMPFHVQCYCMLTPVVKYNCVMFLLKYKTTHKYIVTTKIFLYFFKRGCSLNITANTSGCVNHLHRTNNRK